MSILPGFFPGALDSEGAPTIYTTTMSAGYAAGAYGYARSPWVPSLYEMGSISKQPVTGQTMVSLYYSPGAGGSVIGFSGHILATLTGLTVWVDGVEYPFSTDWAEITSGGNNYTRGQWTGGGSPQFAEFQFYDIEIK